MKELEWLGSSLADLKRFPRAVQRDIGFTLYRVQLGQMPARCKSMTGLPGVYEVRLGYQTDTYRAVYVIKLGSKVFVLHAFQKKSKSGRRTPKADMEVIRSRLAAAKVFAKEDES